MEVIFEELQTTVEVTDPAVVALDAVTLARIVESVAAALAERDAAAAWEARARDPLARR
jgi:hypothetical protein